MGGCVAFQRDAKEKELPASLSGRRRRRRRRDASWRHGVKKRHQGGRKKS